MKYKYKFNFCFMNNLYMFGKSVELYYKGKSKKTSLVGLIFALI